MFSNSPKISIISVNYNNAEGLEQTMDSVLEQTYKNIEYIIIDGNSRDASKAIIAAQIDRIAYWVSEPDSGVYNAMNKGIRAATGDYLMFINSGDLLLHNNVIKEAVNEGLDRDLVYGNLLVVEQGREKVWIVEEDLSFETFYTATIPHPSTFIKKELFERIGPYNEKNKIASDWEFFMLVICKYNCSYKHINLTLSRFFQGGISSDPKNYEMLAQERMEALNKHFPLFVKDYERAHQTRDALRKVRKYIKAKQFVKSLFKKASE